MRALFNTEGPLFSLGEKLFDIMAVSLLWAICCIPIVTIGPATGALYYVAVKQVRKNRGSLLKNYFSSFRDGLRTGIPLTCILLIYVTVIVAVVWAINNMTENGLIGQAGSYLSFAACALLLPFFIILPYLAPILSRFSMAIGPILKLSTVMALRNFWRTLVLLVLIAGTVVLIWFIPYFILILPGACALVCSYLIEPPLRKYTPKPDPDQPIPWYWE